MIESIDYFANRIKQYIPDVKIDIDYVLQEMKLWYSDIEIGTIKKGIVNYILLENGNTEFTIDTPINSWLGNSVSIGKYLRNKKIYKL